MAAISFNNRQNVYYGSTAIRRVYCGPTLVWTDADETVISDFGTAAGAVPSADWRITAGGLSLGQVAGITVATPTAVPTVAVHNVFSAANVRVEVQAVYGNFGTVVVLARSQGTTWATQTCYGVEVLGLSPAPGVSGGTQFVSSIRLFRRVAGVDTTVQTFNPSFTFVSLTPPLIIELNGTNIRVVLGSTVYTATDAGISAAGGVGVGVFGAGAGLKSFTARAL